MNTFESQQNKEILYNLLLNNNIFNGLSQESHQTIKQIFEDTIKNINTNFSQNDLMEKNKKFVQTMIQQIDLLKREINDKKNTTDIEEIYTAQDIKKKNLSEFDNNLNNAVTDFQESMKIKKPDNVSFADNDDSPLENVDDALEKLQKERNLDLHNIKYENEDEDKKILQPVNTKEVVIDESKNIKYEMSDINNTDLLNDILKEQKELREKVESIFDILKTIQESNK